MKKIYKLLNSAIIGLSAVPCAITATSCSNYENLYFSISNDKFEMTFCDRGAAIYNIKYNGVDVTYHPEDKTTFVNPNCEMYHYGKTIGRIIGRVKDGKLEFDGKTYQLQINETSGGRNNSIHGGKDALSYKDFKHYISKDDTGITVAFNYVSPALEAGFPETLDTWIVYKLHNDCDQIDTIIYAIPSGKTVINISNHLYFKLGKTDNIRNHYLTIPANQIVKFDSDQVISGLEEVKPYWDFNTRKCIGKDIDKVAELDPVTNGYDNIWKFSDAGKYVLLDNPESNISLRVECNDSNTDAVICYANCNPRPNQMMNDGKIDTKYGGLAIEPLTYHTAKDLTPIIYSPDKPFYRHITYKFGKIN